MNLLYRTWIQPAPIQCDLSEFIRDLYVAEIYTLL